MDENHHFLCVYHVFEQATGRIVNCIERILTREDVVHGRTIAVQKEEIATQARHGGPAVTVVVHALINID